MQPTKPNSSLFKRSDRWPIALTLLAGALVLLLPAILIGGMLYLTSGYTKLLRDAQNIGSEPKEATQQVEAR